MKTLQILLLITLNFVLLNAEDIQLDDVLTELPTEGHIESKGQIDTYTFTVHGSGVYTFYSTYTTDKTDVDSQLLDSTGKVLVSDANSNSYANFRYQYYLMDGETYSLKVFRAYRGTVGTYLLHVMFENNPNMTLFNWDTSWHYLDANETEIRTIYPLKSGTYTFYSKGETDTIGTLYDSNHNELISNDDNNGSINFKLSYALVANTTYTLEVKNFDSTRNSSYGLRFSSDIAPIIDQNKVKDDFNGDGIADILWRNGSRNHVWLMAKDGTHEYRNIGGKSSEYKIAGRGDFNGDNISDILWRKGNKNYIWYMDANGSHTYKKIASKSYEVKAIADFNNDGISDILWRKGVHNHIWYMKADGNYTYASIGGKSDAYDIAGTGDFNGDGVEDILWRKGYRNYIWYMDVNGSHSYKKIDSKAETFKGIGDFNGDGVDDILWEYGLWFMNKDGSHIYSSIYVTYYNIKVADFNGDGIDDIAKGPVYNYMTTMSFEIKPSYGWHYIGKKGYDWSMY